MDICFDTTTTLGEAFATNAARHGDRVAVTCGSRQWTYREFETLTASIAAGLTALVEPGTDGAMVVILLDRSPTFVATLVGAARAGLTYVPIDPTAPTAYIADLLDQVHPSVVVTSDDRLPSSAEGSARWVTMSQLTDNPDTTVMPVVASSQDPAYVIFTSGSTGRPKGVVVSHHSMINSTRARLEEYGVPERVALLHSPGFDVASGVVFWALLCGGTLVVNEAPMVDVAATVELVHRARITHLVYAAGLYPLLLERISADRPSSLTTVMIGSERWSEVLIDRHAQLLPHTSLYNEYGPTEATVFSSCALVYDGANGRRSALTIGAPLINTGYLLLGEGGGVIEPKVGVTGELAITGSNVAIGYLAQPDLTAERFIELPNGELAYRTGDLVQATTGGAFVFRGRVDRQIKIGGNRIEPGHIETALMTHSDVEQAYVRASTTLAGQPTLVGYLVPASGRSLTPTQARDHLAHRLPPYLIPTVWVVVSTLPRTTNGKIDEHHLPLPLPPPVLTSGAAAGDEVEAELVELLAQATGGPGIAVDADLREMGLASLAFVRFAAAISARFGVEVPIGVLFTAPDLREVARHVRDGDQSSRPTLRVGDRCSDTAPLSAQQRQIWILHHLAPTAAAYTTQCTLELTGDLDPTVLKRALTEVVARHEILRTTFHDGPDGPFQQIHAPWSVALVQVDLSDLDRHDQRHAVAENKQAAMSEGFDIAALPLVRWYLYRLSPTRWQLFQVEHHFVHDGWSATLLLGEIRDAYDALVHLRRNPAPALPVQYRDYATWYQRWRDSEHYQQQKRYWTTIMDGCSPVGVTFEPDKARPSVQTFEGGCVRLALTPEVISRIDAACKTRGVTRFSVFMSAFVLLVWRHTDEADMVIGSAFSNRRQVETANLLGMFVNALPLRLRVNADDTVGAVIRSVMDVLLGAQDHQEFPFADLVEALDLPRDPARNTLFGLMFAFHDSPRPNFDLDGLGGRLSIDHNGSAKNDVNVVCVPESVATQDGARRTGIDILWEYNSALFEPATAHEHAAQFAHIVATLTDEWNTPIADLDLLGPAMTQRILTAAAGPASMPTFTTITDGVDHTMTNAPDMVALVHGQRQLTYRELDALVMRFEAVLADAGLGAGAIVAVAYPRSVELVAAWLAVLRRGAAYVTLDSRQPWPRLNALVRDCGAAAVVCSADAVPTFGITAVPVIDLADVEASPGVPGRPVIPLDAPAYLTYTSGTTGTPKAVIATHANAVTAIHARTVEFGWTQPRTLVTLPVTFDVAASMMMWTLWLGGTVVLPDTDGDEQDPAALARLIDAHDITHLNFVSSFYSVFLDAIDSEAASTLHVIAIGGEPCPPELVARHGEKLPEVALYNEYGPTEATVWCSVARVHPSRQRASADRVTIGRPTAGAALFVVDRHGQLAPVGARGELVVTGTGVAAGYHGRRELTADRFGPLPVGPRAGERAYRTGDAARILASGEFEILGRFDDQLKIRGFRIEAGELIATLTSHPAVAAATVAIHETVASQQLAAFVAAPGNHSDDLVAELQRWLTDRLPAYMVPTLYAVVDELPRTRVGKIDRHRLPTPTSPRATTANTSGPDNGAQRVLLEVWAALLGRRDITVDDDFFTLGGDSLLAIRAVTMARSHGLELSVPAVVRARTIAAIAATLPTAGQITPTEDRRGGSPVALTGIQGWFFAQQFADPDHFSQVRVFDIDPDADDGEVLAVLESIIARHDAFRTVFNFAEGHWQAQLRDAAPAPAIFKSSIAAAQGNSEIAVYVIGMASTLSIADGRLWRIDLCTDAESGRRWVCLALHHLVVDAVSWDILARDIETAYARQRQADNAVRPRAEGLPTYNQLDIPDTELHYWRAVAETPHHPMDTGTRDLTPVGALHRTEHTLSGMARRFLASDLPQLDGPATRSVLLAALAHGVNKVLRQPLWCFVEGHGRDGVAGAAEIVGWLTTLYPVSLSVADDGDLLRAAEEVAARLDEVPAHGAHYAVARYLAPTSPLGEIVAGIDEPEITFNYLGSQPRRLSTDILTPVPVATGAGIGPANTLPTPVDITVIDTGSAMVVRCAIDPARVDVATADAVIAAMVDAIETAAGVVPLGGTPDAPNHFLIHPVDGTIGWALPLATQPGTPWRWIGLPQSDPRPGTSIAGLATEYRARIQNVQPQGPYTITGYSFGAAVAFEVARQLERDGYHLDAVTLIDPPPVADGDPEASLAAQLRRLIPDASVASIAALISAANLSAPQRIQELVRIAGSGLATEVVELIERQVGVLLTNRHALAAWQPTGRVGALTAVISQTTESASGDIARWEQHSRRPLRVEIVAGDHFSMLHGDNAAAVHAVLTGDTR